MHTNHKGKCPSVIPSFQEDSDVRAPSTYRHLRTWALRRVLAFGFVQEYLGTHSYQPISPGPSDSLRSSHLAGLRYYSDIPLK
eukprot:scaffold10936_cov153-Skeletonema_dohrnii-CCMP3373.AAC.1